MKFRKSLTMLAVASALVGGAIVAAPSASAATQNIQVDCSVRSIGGVLTVSPGDTISITGSGTACNYSGTNVPTYADWFTSYTGGVTYDPGTEPFVWVVSPTAPLGLTSALICVGIDTCDVFFAFDVIERSAASSDQLPAPILQALPVPASGSCDAIDDTPFRYGIDSLAGGWSKSWAEWANGGAGGAVCVRTLVYSNSLGAWTVQS